MNIIFFYLFFFHLHLELLAWRGLADSVAQSIPIFGYAITLCYGGLLVARGEIHFKNVLK